MDVSSYESMIFTSTIVAGLAYPQRWDGPPRREARGGFNGGERESWSAPAGCSA